MWDTPSWGSTVSRDVYLEYEQSGSSQTGKVRVYVYVAGSGISDECLELLGINKNTLDGNDYFPAGEIELDSSVVAGKTTVSGAALINSESDWTAVLNALGELDTSHFTSSDTVDNKDYTVNANNHVGEYLSQARADIGYGWGSQHTALFHWPTENHSYGFADQSVTYHLDLMFNTKKITFITGNNGITSGSAVDGTTVDSRTYITGSSIQEPRNLTIPAGYRFVGYYTDADFSTPWNGIGTPLNEDQTVYIKITQQENVAIHYVNVSGAEAGSLSLYDEGLNPETGVATGSTATANAGWHFVGWYSDQACTQVLSNEATYKPTKQKSDRWIDGTTYYAKFEHDAYNVTIHKVDANGNTLSGATFTLMPASGTSVDLSSVGGRSTTDGTLTAGSDGSTFALTGLPVGTYTLRETKAPDGYVSLTDYTVTVTSTGVTVTDGDGEDVKVTAGKDSTYLFSVTNTPGKALPSTGGVGTAPYAVAGAGLMAAAALLYLRRRRA